MLQHLVSVWIHGVFLRLHFFFSFSFFPFVFSFLRQITLFITVTIHGPTTILLKKYIKNGPHGTIHIFKNYFATVFLVFSFSKNKLYPNRPLGPLYNIVTNYFHN